MSDDVTPPHDQALRRENVRLRRLLELQGSTTGHRHQIRNTVALLRAIIRRSAESCSSVEDYAAHLEARLDAIFRIQVAIADSLSDGIDLRMLIADELLTYAASEGELLSIDGPVVLLQPAAAGMVGLAIHELATNAVKFGALSSPKARLAVAWTVADAGDGRLTLALNWVESGVGDLRETPSRRGFGTEVIEGALPHRLGGTAALRFPAGGVRCEVRLPLTSAIGSLREGSDEGADDAF